ncbi:MAG TPA: hypothetical protein VGX91_13065 [Candidatus Cybelea sp.]|nr:hypothetical protein [Candidatus Cybelea sp.]
MLLLRNKFVPFALAAIAASGLAACSGSRSLIPAGGPASIATRHNLRYQVMKNQPPDYMQMAFLLTDGSILTQGESNWGSWYRYVPDSAGSYSDGTWTQVASLPSGYAPDAFASDVLPDGRLFISGGEYNSPGNYDLQLVNLGAIYDPIKNTWTSIGHPSGWGWIGDSPSTILPNGIVIVGDKLLKQDATFNPATEKWTKVGSKGKDDWNAEEGWTLLPDGTILTADVLKAPNSEIYTPSSGTWKSAGSTIVDLRSQSPYHSCLSYGPKSKDCYLPPGEIGPAMLRPNGTVFATGSGQNGSGSGTGHTAVYTIATKTWAAGPDFPNNDNAGDNFAILEPSGNVLVYGDSGEMYEFNGTSLTAEGYEGGVPLLLPTGQVAMFGSQVELYSPSGSSNSSWAPTIQTAPKSVAPGKTYKISGTQFNGMSLAMAFGDEFQNSTNYPLVRITSKKGNVFYARTHGHSSMGVQTGSTVVSTNFDVPSKIDAGTASLVVVANGIASKPVSVTVQ